MKIKLIIITLIITLMGGLSGWLIGTLFSNSPQSRYITILARKYAFNPEKFEISKGDTVHLNLVSLDVTHGFYLEGYDIDAEIFANSKTFKLRNTSKGYTWREANTLVFIANNSGKFRYRCSNTCGTMHAFMQGEMIVSPNIIYHSGIGCVIAFTLSMILTIYLKARKLGES